MENSGGEHKRVCVTGAGGFVASWLVKLLLSKGYTVHGTCRDPSDKKNEHLMKLDKATENLHLFKANMLDYNAVAAAVAGCEGVFHAATPVPATAVPNPEVELITPAVDGTLNVLRACSEARVKRLVVVSSVGAIYLNPNWPRGMVMDEESWSDEEHCKEIEDWYCLSKTIAERKALEYARKNGLDVVTVCPSMIVGPQLQSTVTSSGFHLIRLLKGDPDTREDWKCYVVDVRDVADALLLVYEKPQASGRYVCASHPCGFLEIADMLKRVYPNYKYPKIYKGACEGYLVSSEKLKTLGWKFRPLMETLVDTVECYEEIGFLNDNS